MSHIIFSQLDHSGVDPILPSVSTLASRCLTTLRDKSCVELRWTINKCCMLADTSWPLAMRQGLKSSHLVQVVIMLDSGTKLTNTTNSGVRFLQSKVNFKPLLI